MKKKLLIILMVFVLLFGLVGCSEEVVGVNVDNQDHLSSTKFCEFVKIGDNLYYDHATKIVYIKNYTYLSNHVYTAYYAPNGLPYRYNPETNTLEEIDLIEYFKEEK